jgi:IS5 family transposase
MKSRGYDATMKRAARGQPLTIRDKLRNKRISGKRAPGERLFAVIKTVFKAGHTMVTTVTRAGVKMIFALLYGSTSINYLPSRKRNSFSDSYRQNKEKMKNK